jgi:cytochrome c biogenesis protein CcmG/thiol:disulfide interchange protein DsbE
LPSTSSSAPPEGDRPRRGPLLAAGVVVVLVVAAITAFAVGSSGSGSGSASPPASTGGSGFTSKVHPFVDTAATAELGKPAPNFTLRTLDGKSISLASLRGRPVIVNFWASWCNPCRKEFPLLRSTLQKYARDKLAVVGISFQDIDDDARAFAKQERATWPLAVDIDNGLAAKTYGVRSVPTTYFVTPDGVIADQVFGQLPTGRDFQTSLSKILQAHALGT